MQSEQVPPHVLAAFLAERDVACPCCGYNLRGLSANHCPECRSALKLAINADSAPRGWRRQFLRLAGTAVVASAAVSVWGFAEMRGKFSGYPWYFDSLDWTLACLQAAVVIAGIVCLIGLEIDRTRKWARRLEFSLLGYVVVESLITIGAFIASKL